MVLILHPLKNSHILCHCLIKIWQYHSCWDSTVWTVLQSYTLCILWFSVILVSCSCETAKTILHSIHLVRIFSCTWHDIPVAVPEATRIYCKPSVSMPLHDFNLILMDIAAIYRFVSLSLSSWWVRLLDIFTFLLYVHCDGSLSSLSTHISSFYLLLCTYQCRLMLFFTNVYYKRKLPAWKIFSSLSFCEDQFS